ncbi:MAG: hypothetical protein HY698_09335 [Deltaproteobacteria bacterium]|nr:hypothetical protein [Deltaproteobacteria bacterium]
MAAFSHEPTGQVLVVTRLVGPTENPHDTGTLKTILAGLRGSARGYRLISARARDLKLRDKRPPAVYDAWLGATRHRARVVMGARFLVYQSHVLALMIEVPRGSRDLRSARRIVESFRPARR